MLKVILFSVMIGHGNNLKIHTPIVTQEKIEFRGVDAMALCHEAEDNIHNTEIGRTEAWKGSMSGENRVAFLEKVKIGNVTISTVTYDSSTGRLDRRTFCQVTER